MAWLARWHTGAVRRIDRGQKRKLQLETAKVVPAVEWTSLVAVGARFCIAKWVVQRRPSVHTLGQG